MTLKEIFKEWHKEFPALSKYTDRTLFIRINPLLIGIRFSTKWGDQYVLSSEIIPLWETNPKLFGLPLCYENLELWNSCSSIEYKRHHLYFKDAVECAKKQFGNILKEEVLFEDLIVYISKVPKYNPFDWIDILRLKYGLALYFNKQDMLESIKRIIENKISHWVRKQTVEIITHKIISTEEWHDKFYSGLRDRYEFMEAIDVNCQLPKVAKLNTGHFIGVEEYTKYVRKLTWFEKIRSLFTK